MRAGSSEAESGRGKSAIKGIERCAIEVMRSHAGDPDLVEHKVQAVVRLSQRARMSSTYKPALLKAIARISSRRPSNAITLRELGAEFARLFWNQTIVFHLRQAATITKEPEVLGQIRKVSAAAGVRDFSRLPRSAAMAIEIAMAQILTIDVLRRFHNNAPVSMTPLFCWVPGTDYIALTDKARDFVVANHTVLDLIANHWWAGYLEKVNVLAPAIINKVQADGARRGSLTAYLAILAGLDEGRCFYCNRVFSEALRPSVDHVLPWSFLLADPLWDLVLACMDCNLAKSDRLPERHFMDRLVERNVLRSHRHSAIFSASPSIESGQEYRLYEAAISVEWPGYWVPASTY